MRGCLLGAVMLLAVGLVAAALWFGAIGLLGTSGALPSGLPGRPTDAALTAGSPTPGRPTPGRPTAAATTRPVTPAPPAAGETQLARLDDDALTAALRRALAQEQGGLTVDDARVRARDGRLEVTGRVRGLLPLPVDILLVGRVLVRDGRPAVAVERMEGGGMALPDAAARRVEPLLANLALVPIPDGIDLTRVEVGDGSVTVYGRRR